MVIRGAGGRLAVGVRTAGVVIDWTLVRTSDTPTFDAHLTLAHRDALWWGQAPGEVVLHMGGRRWLWPIGAWPTPADSITVALSGAPDIQ